MVLVDEPTGWRAYFCTDTSASVADILGTVADRFSLEITFRECKQVVGAGQQQVRFIWANVGAFHVCLWTFTMTEAWAWGRKDGGVGGPLGLAVGQARHAGRATRTSGGRGVVNCWARRFVRFYARGYRGGNSGHGRSLPPSFAFCPLSSGLCNPPASLTGTVASGRRGVGCRLTATTGRAPGGEGPPLIFALSARANDLLTH